MIDGESHPFDFESITLLDYSDRKLSTIPRSIASCPILMSLSLARNGIQHVSLDGLLHLKYLNISSNRTITLSLGRLPSLKVLSAHGNCFAKYSDVSKALLAVSSTLEDLSFQLPGGSQSPVLCCDPQYLYRVKTTLPQLVWLDGEPISSLAGVSGLLSGLVAVEEIVATMLSAPRNIGDIANIETGKVVTSVSAEFRNLEREIRALESMIIQ
jgi:Leucine-rich repeat (LRR) protein